MKSFSNSGWKLGGGETTASRGGRNVGGRSEGAAQETDPLIRSNSNDSNQRGLSSAATTATASSYINSSDKNSNLRERRKSPIPSTTGSTTISMENPSSTTNAEPSSSYTRIQDDNSNNNTNPQRSRSGNISLGEQSTAGASYQNSNASNANSNRSLHSLRRSYVVEKAARDATESGGSDLPPLIEIPEEIYAVRKAALQVLKPLTRTWVSLIALH